MIDGPIVFFENTKTVLNHRDRARFGSCILWTTRTRTAPTGSSVFWPGKDFKCYPLVMTNIAIENGHRNSEFSHSTWWFSIVMLVYRRVGSFPTKPNGDDAMMMHWCSGALVMFLRGSSSFFVAWPVLPKCQPSESHRSPPKRMPCILFGIARH